MPSGLKRTMSSPLYSEHVCTTTKLLCRFPRIARTHFMHMLSELICLHLEEEKFRECSRRDKVLKGCIRLALLHITAARIANEFLWKSAWQQLQIRPPPLFFLSHVWLVYSSRQLKKCWRRRVSRVLQSLGSQREFCIIAEKNAKKKKKKITKQKKKKIVNKINNVSRF